MNQASSLTKICAADLQTIGGNYPIIDVRTPKEFEHGHIPGAYNIPLFSNEERVDIGTTYVQEGKEPAMRLGLKIIGPQMDNLIAQVKELEAKTKSQTFIVHCWRGGMRSSSFAWLLQFFKYNAYLLEGGYKAYRAHTRNSFAQPRKIVILGGPTGSEKTELLHMLSDEGHAIVDLEGLAHHKGSVFGALGQQEQPTQEQFENNLAQALTSVPLEVPLWIEDESRRVGDLFIPDELWNQMRAAPVITVAMPREQRITNLCDQYGSFAPAELINCVTRIYSHLGSERANKIIELIKTQKIAEACGELLHHYDKAYQFGLAKRPTANIVSCEIATNTDAIARLNRAYRTLCSLP